MSEHKIKVLERQVAALLDERDNLKDGYWELLSVLKDVRACLETANNTPSGPIIDTIWYGPAETLFDYIDAALEKVGAGGTAPEGHNAQVVRREAAGVASERTEG